MKHFLFLFSLLLSLGATAQVNVSSGKNSTPYTPIKDPKFYTYNTADHDYFIINQQTPTFEQINTLIVSDKTGNIITGKEISINAGIMGNSFDVVNLVVLGNRTILFVENKIKGELKNHLLAKVVDINGNVEATGTKIGSMDFAKPSNGGKWYASVTPDKKHVAIIGINPHAKDVADQIDYYILDENLKETSKGKFSFAGFTKEMNAGKFLASDKGDFYIVNEAYDKSYTYPVLYKFTIGGTAEIIPVMIADPSLKNLNYAMELNSKGDLVIAGYTQKKANFSAGDIANNGSWSFNSSIPSEVKTFPATNPLASVVARKIIFNGDTFYVIGERYKKEEQKIANPSPMQLSNRNYDYTYGDINVTAFDLDGNKKFETPISRNWTASTFDQDLTVGAGIINNKLALIFNDKYNKYFEDKHNIYVNVRVPVTVTVTNDGLMEAPRHFFKELDTKVSTYVLFPQFTSAGNDRVVVLMGKNDALKTATFTK